MAKTNILATFRIPQVKNRIEHIFQNLDAIHSEHKRPYRDIHNIWQWAIIDADLIRRMNDLGFKIQFYKNCGPCGQLQNVENHAFVFSVNHVLPRG